MNDVASLQFSASSLDKMRLLLGSTNPFLIISKSTESGEYVPVHRTEFYKGKCNVTWKPFDIKVQKLCNGDHQRTLQIVCYDHRSSGSHRLVGSLTTSLDDITQKCALGTASLPLINTDKKRKKKDKYKNSGTLTIMQCKVKQVPGFLDYIRGGLQIALTVCVDFTGSNGM